MLGLLQDIIALKPWCQPSAMLELRGRRRAVAYSVLNVRNGDRVSPFRAYTIILLLRAKCFDSKWVNKSNNHRML